MENTIDILKKSISEINKIRSRMINRAQEFLYQDRYALYSDEPTSSGFIALLSDADINQRIGRYVDKFRFTEHDGLSMNELICFIVTNRDQIRTINDQVKLEAIHSTLALDRTNFCRERFDKITEDTKSFDGVFFGSDASLPPIVQDEPQSNYKMPKLISD